MAALATTALLVTPFLYDYDLVVLAAPLAWIAVTGARSGFRSGEVVVGVLLYLLPLPNIVVRRHVGVPLGPPFIICLLVMIWSRGVGGVSALGIAGAARGGAA